MPVPSRLLMLLRAVVFLTTGTQAGEGDGIVVESKARWMEIGQPGQIEIRIAQIGHLAAANATDMVMAAGVGIKARLGLLAADFLDQADTHECVQDAIDRGPRQPADTLFEIVVELICRRMVLAPDQFIEQNAALVGQAQTVLAANVFHSAAIFVIGVFHG